MIVIRVLSIVALFVSFASAIAGSVTLAWDAVNDPRVGGYQVLYGVASGVYSNILDVHGGREATTYTVQNLNPATRYFFVARAYSIDKSVFSDNSNEVNATIPLGAPGNLSVTIGASVSVHGSFLGAPLGVGL